MAGTGLIRRAATTRPALRLRAALGIRPPHYVPSLREAVSDLFVWRCDEEWETWFDLFHAVGVINPGYREPTTAELVLFDGGGRTLASRTYPVEFARLRRIDLRSEFPECRGVGCFGVFHQFDRMRALDGRTCLSELGYVSYRRRGAQPALRSYVHGNLYALGRDLETGEIRSLGAAALGARYRYRPQLRFDDCQGFELFVPNPVPGSLEVRLELLDAEGRAFGEERHRLPPRGSFRYGAFSAPRPALVQVLSAFPMLRPLVFKHYGSHFDVFHA